MAPRCILLGGGGFDPPTPAPHCAIRLTRENLVYRSCCPLGSGRRSGRGGRLPGQLCPTQIWCVSLQCRSAFAGQLEASWKPVDPGPWPSFPPFSSCPNQVNRPQEHEEAIRTERKQSFHFAHKCWGDLKLSKGFISAGVGPRSRLKFSWPGQTQLLAILASHRDFSSTPRFRQSSGWVMCT